MRWRGTVGAALLLLLASSTPAPAAEAALPECSALLFASACECPYDQPYACGEMLGLFGVDCVTAATTFTCDFWVRGQVTARGARTPGGTALVGAGAAGQVEAWCVEGCDAYVETRRIGCATTAGVCQHTTPKERLVTVTQALGTCTPLFVFEASGEGHSWAWLTRTGLRLPSDPEPPPTESHFRGNACR